MNKADSSALKRLEKEYEDFVYSVSHDFAAPLRHIENYTRFLLEDIENPSDEMQEYMGYITSSLKKIKTMQEILLSLSRIKTDPREWENIDCNTLIENILQDLSSNYNLNEYQIRIDQMPIIKVEPILIKTLLNAVIDNALKFHAPHSENKQITITASTKNNRHTLQIQDNGIGIPSNNLENIFKIFRCLKPTEYKGDGAGLTFAEKIARLHNGKIWASSDKSANTTTLHISVPAQ